MDFIEPDKFQDLVKQASESVFTQIVQMHPRESFYVFALWTDDSLQFLEPATNTIEQLNALQKSLNENADLNLYSSDDIMDLRWSYGDWGFFANTKYREFEIINRELNKIFYADISEEAFQQLIEPFWLAIFNAMHILVEEGFFKKLVPDLEPAILLVGNVPDHLVKHSVLLWNKASVAQSYLHANDIT